MNKENLNTSPAQALDDKPTAIEDSMDIAYNLAIDHVLVAINEIWPWLTDDYKAGLTKKLNSLKK